MIKYKKTSKKFDKPKKLYDFIYNIGGFIYEI